MHPRWIAPLCVAFRANSAAIPPSKRLASPAPRRSRCSCGFIHGLLAGLLFASAGEPLRAQEADGPTGSVVGLVYDSTASAPLANARVAVMGTSAIAETDEDGQFRLDEVPVGEHTVMFFHPRLGTLGVAGTTQQVVVDGESVVEAYLAVPSRETILSAWCSAEGGAGGTSIGGIVTDALTGVPLPGARVSAIGDRVGALQRSRMVAEARTGNSGEYRLCGLDATEEISVTATFGTNDAMPVAIAHTGARILDITIHISDPVTITGTVINYANRAPIEGARVQLVGTSHDVFTDSAGKFGFSGVPPGKQIIQTDQLGYATRIDSLTAFSQEALGLEIVLSTEAIVLEPLIVTGRRGTDRILTTPGTRFSGLTEAQVDSIAPRVFDFANLARAARMPGLSVTETYIPNAFGDPQMGVCITMVRARGGRNPNACNMVEVRVNDGPVPDPAFFLLEMNPQDVRRIQFITPLEAGLLYGDRGANGVLLIYTK